MKLLLITRKVNVTDERTSFFVDWIREFALHTESLVILTFGEIATELPSNVYAVSVCSSECGSLKKLFELTKTLLKKVSSVDAVFAHMMPVYAICASPWCKLFRRPLFLWYAHSSVDFKLRLATQLADGIFTPSSGSFLLNAGNKVNIVGHAISVKKFSPVDDKNYEISGPLKIITVGRVAASKNVDIIVEAVGVVRKNNPNLHIKLLIVGATAMKQDEMYLAQVKQLTQELGIGDCVDFLGPKQHNDVVDLVRNADIFVNMSDTGSLDKAAMEAMAAKTVVVSSNNSIVRLFGDFEEELTVRRKDAADLADKILNITSQTSEHRRLIAEYLYETVKRHHGIDDTIMRIVNVIEDKIGE